MVTCCVPKKVRSRSSVNNSINSSISEERAVVELGTEAVEHIFEEAIDVVVEEVIQYIIEEVVGETVVDCVVKDLVEEVIAIESINDLESSKADETPSMDDFTLVGVLGKGSFGKVTLCQHKLSNRYVAIKSIHKSKIITSSKSVESLYSEKKIFEVVNNNPNPFLVNLFPCFQTNDYACFVMEYAAGGDLNWHIENEGAFTEPKAVFYAACVVLGVTYLHEHNIIYRDIKLNNLIVSTDGYIKIADYGLCKMNIGFGDRTASFCGTAEFVAPEILIDTSYTRSVDWWAFGILIYKMLVGEYPFKSWNRMQIFDSIISDEVDYPHFLSSKSIDIMKKLLCKDPENRLGSSQRGADEIKAESFFEQIVWSDLLEKKIPAPVIPIVNSPHDTSNFDDKYEYESTEYSSIDDLSEGELHTINNFTYNTDWYLK